MLRDTIFNCDFQAGQSAPFVPVVHGGAPNLIPVFLPRQFFVTN